MAKRGKPKREKQANKRILKTKANIAAGIVEPIDTHLDREVIPVKVDRWTKVFLRVLRLTGKVNSAARAAGRSISHVYAAKSKSPAFRERWERALDGFAERRIDSMETEAFRRAVKGVKQPYVSGGRVVTNPETGHIVYQRKYSDALLAKLLEAHVPEKYGRKQVQDVQVTVSLTSPALQARMSDPVIRAQICDLDAEIANSEAPRMLDVTEASKAQDDA